MKKLICLFLLTASLFACSRQDDAEDEGEISAPDIIVVHVEVVKYETHTFVAEQIELPVTEHSVVAVYTHENIIYYCEESTDTSGERQLIVTGISSGGEIIRVLELDTGVYISFLDLTLTIRGDIAILLTAQKTTERGDMPTLYYIEYDMTGKEIFRLEFDTSTISYRFYDDNLNTYLVDSSYIKLDDITQAVILKDKGMAVATDYDTYYRLDNQYPMLIVKYLHDGYSVAAYTQDFYLRHDGLIRKPDGGYVILHVTNAGVLLHDYDSGAFEDINSDLLNSSHRFLSTSGASPYDFLFYDSSFLYGYNIGKREATTILNWVELGFHTLPPVLNVGFLTDGRISLMTDSELFILSPVKRSDLPEKITLTLGGLMIGEDVRAAVVAFNRESLTHTIVVEEYGSAVFWDVLSDGIRRLQIELMTGRGPDIIYDPYEFITNRRVFHDLYRFIEADRGLDINDFFPNVLSGFEDIDGRLPVISNAFSIDTIIAVQETAGHIQSWTPQDLQALVQNSQHLTYPLGIEYTSELFLHTMVENSGSFFIDWDNYRANFDNAEFMSLLETAMMLHGSVDPSYSLGFSGSEGSLVRLQNGEQLLFYAAIYGPDYYQLFSEFLGESMIPLGIPTDNGGTHVILPWAQMGINIATEEPRAAWEFMREFLLPTANIEFGFPLRTDLYDEMISASTLSDNDADNLRHIIDSARPRGRRLRPEARSVIDADFADFRSGIRDADYTARIIQNRIQRHLNEQELVGG